MEPQEDEDATQQPTAEPTAESANRSQARAAESVPRVRNPYPARTAMDTEPTPAPAELAELEDPLAEAGKGRIVRTDSQRARLMAEMEARPALGGQDVSKAGTRSQDWKYPDGKVLRFFQGAQINMYLMSPGKPPGRKIFSLENSKDKPASAEAIALRQEAFNEANRLIPTNDLVLAAIRDTVLLKRQMEPGTPGIPRGPGAPGPKRAPMPPRPPGAASGPGWPRP